MKNPLPVNDTFQECSGTLFARLGIQAVKPLGPKVPNPRSELQTQQVEESKDEFGVSSGVGGVFEDREVGLVVEDLIEDVGGISHGRGDDLGAILGVLVRGPGVESQPFPQAEVSGKGRRVLGSSSHWESLAIGGR